MGAVSHNDMPNITRAQCEPEDFHPWIQLGSVLGTRDSTRKNTEIALALKEFTVQQRSKTLNIKT